MHKAIPVTLATAALFVVVWRFEPTVMTSIPVAAPSTPTASGSPDPGAEGSQNTPNTPDTKTVAGSVESTRWGSLQVQAMFSDGQLVDIQVIQAPNDGPTNRALPTLRTAALQTKSASIDTVSGATQTSEAYIDSLQAAIDSRDK